MNSVFQPLMTATILASTLGIFTPSTLAQYKQVNLDTNTSGTGKYLDPLIVNAWGVGYRDGGPFWVTDEGTGVVTIYDQRGEKANLFVTVPPAPSLPAGTLGTPTGLVVNPTSDFVITKNGKSGPALFIFDSVDGTISGWNPDVDPYNAIIMVDNSTKSPFPASYSGLEIARNKAGKMILYASDEGFTLATSNNEIDMFDDHFQPIGHFSDPHAPPNMTVYNVQHVDGKLYVPFAAFVSLSGGYVSVFDTDGNFLEVFAANSPTGPLQAPFGILKAPKDFGEFSGKLLIGGVEDGHINAYDLKTHNFLGILRENGKPIVIDGLWAMVFGGGTKASGKRNQLFFVGGCNFDPNVASTGSFGYVEAKHREDDDKDRDNPNDHD
jgi:uncharacterized protein (TIGR03118 family)